MPHRPAALRSLLVMTWLAVTPAHAEPPREAPATRALADRLTALIEKSGLGGSMGAVVADAWTGERLYTLNPETPRNPASNMKLVTAATALVALGPEHRLRTSVAGAIDESGRVEALVVRGEGDPSLTFADLLAFARRLTELGVREVDQLVIDGSYFDDRLLPPAFEQQPREVAAFRAAVAALSVDRNAFELRVAPGPEPGAPAQVRLRCPDHFEVSSTLTTAAEGRPKIVADQKPAGERLALELSGSIPRTTRDIGYERRVESPLFYAGHCMQAALRTLGIRGPSAVRVETPSAQPPLLFTHESAPLAVLLGRVGKHSDNYFAEMLLKVIGAESTHAKGSAEAGLARAQAVLASAGVAPGTATLVNGSGLFKGSAVSPSALIKLLSHVYRDPTLRPEYLGQLAIAGKEGTLASRLTDLKRPRVVRAKTGTLDDVVALSGYVLAPTTERTLAFSFLVNGVSGRQWMARDLVDQLVRALVEYAYP